jgi:hypothetical protein
MAKGDIKYTATFEGVTDTRSSKRNYSHTVFLYFDLRLQKQRGLETYQRERERNRAFYQRLAQGPIFEGHVEADVERARQWLAVDEAAGLAELAARYDAEIARFGTGRWLASGQFAGSLKLAMQTGRSRMRDDSTITAFKVVELQRS